jgi:zinc D-Ala-D-Ala carboxypeptidase
LPRGHRGFGRKCRRGIDFIVTSLKQLSVFTRRLVPIHRELGIPTDYATKRHFTPQIEAVEAELVEVGINDEGRAVRLIRPAAESWANMRIVAARNDIELMPISGFRSISRQTEIFREKLAAGQSVMDILRYVAAPGFSEHHTGRALDIGSPEHTELDEEFAQTSAFRWLEQHAEHFGFTLTYPPGNPHGIGYEPWHWCWHAG